jgi:hypothetical protein
MSFYGPDRNHGFISELGGSPRKRKKGKTAYRGAKTSDSFMFSVTRAKKQSFKSQANIIKEIE